MGKRGPQPLGFEVELRTTISPEIDAGLTQLVEVSGVSKATVVRTALLSMLTTGGLLFPDAADSLVVTRPAGTPRGRKHS